MKFLKNARNSILTMSAASAVTMPVALAAGEDKALISQILDIIYTMALYIGIVLLAWGAIMLILALKNEDADSKSRAIMLIAVAVALITVKLLVGPIVNNALNQI